ncbi:MAG: hypothetical protein PUC25_10245 [Prevotellaceae bacterium]|nr:hypothetical protein [Prevotellaceae bacterium]
MKTMIERMGLMMMVLLSALTLTSCDEDTETAYDLDGIWQGTINGNYYQDRYGYTESWDTEIRFYQNGDFSRGGSGEERDWDYRGKCYSSRFDWKVRNGRIYLYYDDGYNIVIDRYDLYWRSNTQRFRGYFEDFDTGDQLASFDLVKVVDWHDFSKKSQDNGLFDEEKKE